jgi:hypothetical protein
MAKLLAQAFASRIIVDPLNLWNDLLSPNEYTDFAKSIIPMLPKEASASPQLLRDVILNQFLELFTTELLFTESTMTEILGEDANGVVVNAEVKAARDKFIEQSHISINIPCSAKIRIGKKVKTQDILIPYSTTTVRGNVHIQNILDMRTAWSIHYSLLISEILCYIGCIVDAPDKTEVNEIDGVKLPSCWDCDSAQYNISKDAVIYIITSHEEVFATLKKEIIKKTLQLLSMRTPKYMTDFTFKQRPVVTLDITTTYTFEYNRLGNVRLLHLIYLDCMKKENLKKFMELIAVDVETKSGLNIPGKSTCSVKKNYVIKT